MTPPATSAERRGSRYPGWLVDLRRAVLWHRRLVASGLLAGSMAFALSALSPGPPPSVHVVAAARDLASGTSLGVEHLDRVAVPPEAAPAGALRRHDEALGRVLAAPVRRGEPLTDVRLVGPSLLDAYGPDLVAAPVRVADAETVGLLRVGDLIDILAAAAPDAVASAPESAARLVAASVPVITLPRTKGDAFGARIDEGALLVVATTDDTAARLAAAAVSSRLSVTLRSSRQ